MIPFLKRTKYFFVLILISFIVGCSSDNDDNLPAVEAAFTYFVDGTTGTVEFTNTSMNANSYFWDLGNGNTTTEENPIDTYTESGEYTVQLIAKNIAGGSDTISQMIEISLPVIPVEETVKLPLDFQLDTSNYEITDFDGGNLTVVANPFSNDMNNSTQVGKMIKNAGEVWGGSAIALDEAIDFSENKTFQMKVYSPRVGAKVLLKVENADDSNISYEVETETTKASEWETLTFDYSGVDTTQTYDKVILIFDNGTEGDGSDNFTFYIDNIELVDGGTGTAPTTAAPTPTHEASNVISVYSDAYTNISGTDYNPGWGQSTVQSEVTIENNNTMLYEGLNYQGIVLGSAQDVSGMTHLHIDYWTQNSTTLNAYIISTGPVETGKVLTVPTTGWVSIDIPLADFSPVDLADIIQMKFDGDGDVYIDNIYFYSDTGGGDTTAPVITLNGDATMNLTVGDTFTDPGATATDDTDDNLTDSIIIAGDTVDTATAGTYTITYNVSDAAGNAATEVTRTVVVAEATSNDTTIIDYENNLTGITPGLFESGGSLIANPVSGGLNTSTNVYEITYTNANQWWGGVGFKLEDGILDDQATTYKVKMYSTVAPTNVLFQVEVEGNDPVGQVQTINTANEWVELTFTLENIPTGINRVLVRPDVGDQTGTKPNSGTLYIDDIACAECTLGTSGGGGSTSELTSNGDFETGDETGWMIFQNSGSATLDNTVNNGGSWSGKLTVGESGGNPAFKQERIGGGTVASGDVVQVQFDHMGSITQPGAAINVLLFGEGASEVSFTQNLAAGFTTENTWNTYTGTFTIPNDANVSEGVSVLIETVCGAVAGCNVTMNIDNVSVILNP